jgi:uncharacterized protein involved in exopolysaccharide biosynthesis
MLWARRLIVIVTLVSCVIGAFFVTLIATPRYQAKADILLNLLRPDPINGEIINTRALGTYVGAQIVMLKGDEVAGQVAEDLGWTTDPGLIAAYARRPKTDTRDFRRWLASRVADVLNANLTNGGVLTITFDSPSPVEARNGAQSARQTFMDVAIADRRREAAKTAQWYSLQADQARLSAEKAETAKAAFERESGIMMGSGKVDLETERLQALASQAAAPPPMAVLGGGSPAANQLSALDAQMALLAGNLGPNHPQMQELKVRRAILAEAVARETARQQQQALGTGARSGYADQALQAQKSRVIGQRDQVERLRQLQGEVDLRRAQYTRMAGRAADLMLQAAATDTGMRPLGVVVTPRKPIFPNKLLMMGGAAGLGLGLGLGLALLVELIWRRVRGPEDLENGVEVPFLAVVELPSSEAPPSKARASTKKRPTLKAA